MTREGPSRGLGKDCPLCASFRLPSPDKLVMRECGWPSSTASIATDVPGSGELIGDSLLGLPLLLSGFNSEESLLCTPAKNEESLL